MSFKDYVYPKVGGSYRFNLIQKCEGSIGRSPLGMFDVDDTTILRFDPPLSVEENINIDMLLTDPSTACDAPNDVGNTFVIPDLFDSDFKAQLSAQLGCTVTVWFTKSSVNAKRPDLAEIHFSKELSIEEKESIERAIQDMPLGWV